MYNLDMDEVLVIFPGWGNDEYAYDWLQNNPKLFWKNI